MGGSGLSKPVTAQHLQRGQSSHVKVGFAETQGWRESHEDCHILEPCWGENIGEKDKGLFAIFDGHGGRSAADFASKHFPSKLLEAMKPLPTPSSSSSSNLLRDRLNEEALIQSFINCDDAYRNSPDRQAGTTACMVLTERLPQSTDTTTVSQTEKAKYFVRFVNLGDSRALLVSLAFNNGDGKTRIKLATKDHKPDDPDEFERITKAGSFVIQGRVGGGLNLSRVLGDFQYKANPTLSPAEQACSCIPDIYTTGEGEGESVVEAVEGDIIVLGCDGIFEVSTDEEVVAMVQQRILYQLYEDSDDSDGEEERDGERHRDHTEREGERVKEGKLHKTLLDIDYARVCSEVITMCLTGPPKLKLNSTAKGKKITITGSSSGSSVTSNASGSTSVSSSSSTVSSVSPPSLEIPLNLIDDDDDSDDDYDSNGKGGLSNAFDDDDANYSQDNMSLAIILLQGETETAGKREREVEDELLVGEYFNFLPLLPVQLQALSLSHSNSSSTRSSNTPMSPIATSSTRDLPLTPYPVDDDVIDRVMTEDQTSLYKGQEQGHRAEDVKMREYYEKFFAKVGYEMCFESESESGGNSSEGGNGGRMGKRTGSGRQKNAVNTTTSEGGDSVGMGIPMNKRRDCRCVRVWREISCPAGDGCESYGCMCVSTKG